LPRLPPNLSPELLSLALHAQGRIHPVRGGAPRVLLLLLVQMGAPRVEIARAISTRAVSCRRRASSRRPLSDEQLNLLLGGVVFVVDGVVRKMENTDKPSIGARTRQTTLKLPRKWSLFVALKLTAPQTCRLQQIAVGGVKAGDHCVGRRCVQHPHGDLLLAGAWRQVESFGKHGADKAVNTG
jgi:hypothetical protein